MHTPEAFAKMKATVSTPEFKALQSKKSKEIHLRPEVRAKLSEAAKGRVKSAETRAKISINMTGHATSLETRAKIGAKSLGRKNSEASKLRMSEIFSSLPAADRTRQRLKKFEIVDGRIVKYCDKHGLVTNILVKRSKRSSLSIKCAECEREAARKRYAKKSARDC